MYLNILIITIVFVCIGLVPEVEVHAVLQRARGQGHAQMTENDPDGQGLIVVKMKKKIFSFFLCRRVHNHAVCVVCFICHWLEIFGDKLIIWLQ